MRREGGYVPEREANFSRSRALTHPCGGTKRITGSSEVKRGLPNHTGHALSRMAAILDFMS